MMTYISLFSSSGVGCYGFKENGFECIATNELIDRRLKVQMYNKKCKYESGYICGDITSKKIKQKLFEQIDYWKKYENIDTPDVIIATPPCQGMSVANHKKTDNEIVRNSLVIESIKIIKKVNPKFFIFENVSAFMKTICTDVDGKKKTISEAIENNLGSLYSYVFKVINFKNYGACSSRQRTLVIGVSNKYSDECSPYELFPDFCKEKTLRDTIGHLKSLKEMGEIDETDIYHFFRVYPERMRSWISGLKEGESAFDNEMDEKKPHQIINGKLVINKNKNGDKYRRQIWDKIGPCIHTRNDQMASQNTIHPSDDRVFSIRELMLMMTVPYSFKWSEYDIDELNTLSNIKKKSYLKKEEINIRQSLGEAVPTIIFREIAKIIKKFLNQFSIYKKEFNEILEDKNFNDIDYLIDYIDKNPLNLSDSALCRIAEIFNGKRSENAAYYTNKSLITEILKRLPDFANDELHILEPSVGVGCFVPLIMKRFEGKKIVFDLVDINKDSLKILNALLKKHMITDLVKFNFINCDFLFYNSEVKYDYVIGNPPYVKMKQKDENLKKYREVAVNKKATNICSFFLDKAVKIGKCVALVLPKFILNTPEFAETREYLSKLNIKSIIDFGEYGFPGVLIETVALVINTTFNAKDTEVYSLTNKINIVQKQNYICDKKLPYWVIYRNLDFDNIYKKLDFDVFDVFRDRQITNSLLSTSGQVWVLKARNISDDGSRIEHISGYDSYINVPNVKELSVYEYFDRNDVFLTPNMTYNPRVIRKPLGVVVNGSVAILILKKNRIITDEQLKYFSSPEYRMFYQIARNYQTRSLNIDSCSVYFFGLLKRQFSVEIL